MEIKSFFLSRMKDLMKIGFFSGLIIFLLGCNSSETINLDSELTLFNQKTLSLESVPSIQGPLIAIEGNLVSLELVNVTELIKGIEWIVDGTKVAANQRTLNFEVGISGIVEVEVRLLFDENHVVSIKHFITVIEYLDGFECAQSTRLIGSDRVWSEEEQTYHLDLPNCLKNKITKTQWLLNGKEVAENTRTLTHKFSKEDLLKNILTLNLTRKGGVFTIHKEILVFHKKETVEDEPVTNECSFVGQEFIIENKIVTEHQSCGQQGQKELKINHIIKKVCELNPNKQLIWRQITEEKIISESECRGQSCVIPGSSQVIKDQEILLGHLSSQVIEPLSCKFQEEGYFKKYQLRKDMICNNGVLTDLREYKAELLEERSCPIYTWNPTELWTDCSADCGGKQQRVYQCQDQYLRSVEGHFCESKPPVDERICSRAPEKVTRIDETKEEEIVGTSQCGSKQIGVVVLKRIKVTQKEFRCVNHEIVQVNELVNFSQVQRDNQCKDYVASRCSHDSLSISQAKGRFDWMKKCEKEVPMIKDFLNSYYEFGLKNQAGRGFDSSRPLYVTFMIAQTQGKNTVWKAPTSVQSSCEVPPNAYIAAVCVASCATPEQMILTQPVAQDLPQWSRFDEALLNKHSFVITLANTKLNKTNHFVKTKVDQWVTELIDTEHEIGELKMKSGKEIRLTLNHPVVTADGRLKLVQDLKEGDYLVNSNFEFDPIIEIKKFKYYGKVYNVFTQSAAPQHNIVLINDFLTGSAMFQNEAANLVNRRLFRSKLIQHVFNKK